MSSSRHQWLTTRKKVTSCKRCALNRVFGNRPGVYKFDYYRGDYYIGTKPDACERQGDQPMRSPFRDALRLLCGGREPPVFVRGHGTEGLTDREVDELQSWAVSHAALDWMLGIHVIETAESMVRNALLEKSLKGEP